MKDLAAPQVRGQPLGRKSSGKNAAVRLNKNRPFSRNPRNTVQFDPILCFRWLNRIFVGTAPEGIRSVSHPVLARDLRMISEPHSTFEPKEARRIAPGLAPSGPFFLVNVPLTGTPSLAQVYSDSPAKRPARPRRAQKTFSAGPRSLNIKELWFPENSSAALGVQPVFDSRHGRITCKVLRSCVTSKWRKAAASNQTRGLVVQPLSWLTAALKF